VRVPGRQPGPDVGPLVGGRYQLAKVLGRGGMGVVWEARDERLKRTVAIKEVVLPGVVDEEERAELRARTMLEARTAARIWADGSVAIYDVVEHDGRPWIVMEHLDPRTLQDEIAERGRLPAMEVAQIGAALLNGLSAAHAAGILHRDVKPSNVMFREGPGGRRAVLGDFGIAHFDGDATLTSTGMVMGSPAYVAPERAQGKAATPASDLWSLGATLWAALEGRSPFQRENALATLTAVITEEAPRAEHAGPLQPLLQGLLRKEAAARLDAAAARHMLAAVLAPEPTRVAVVPPPARAVQPPAVDPRWWDPSETPETEPPAGAARQRWRVPLLAVLIPGLFALGAVLTEQEGAGDPEGAGPTPSSTATAEVPAVVPDAGQPDGQEQQDTAGDPPPGTSGDTSADQTVPAPADDQAAGGSGTSDQAGTQAGSEGAASGDSSSEGSGSDGSGSSGTAAAVAVPAGYQVHSDPTGFSVMVPEGWTASYDAPRVYLKDPSSRAYLLIDQSDQPKPDPVADWQAQEPSVAARLPNYERIGEIHAVEYRGWQAADWEFVFGENQGTHVLNRNIVTSPTQAYALYWSVPSSRWDELEPIHQQALASFQPGE
jgi:hypothetical protein